MFGLKSTLFCALQAIVLAFLLFRAPSTMTTGVANKPWADGPCPLITTPQYATKKVFEITD